ncbi:MAG: hypothetical protein FWF59_13790 [Turicibacter sp.]|nr:hypothetical protein [Turicibacter sp.]
MNPLVEPDMLNFNENRCFVGRVTPPRHFYTSDTKSHPKRGDGSRQGHGILTKFNGFAIRGCSVFLFQL